MVKFLLLLFESEMDHSTMIMEECLSEPFLAYLLLTGQWLLKGGGAIKGNSGYLAHNSWSITTTGFITK